MGRRAHGRYVASANARLMTGRLNSQGESEEKSVVQVLCSQDRIMAPREPLGILLRICGSIPPTTIRSDFYGLNFEYSLRNSS